MGNKRLNQLVSRFGAAKIDAFLVTKDTNIAYLTGFPASESWLLVTPKRSFYITDFRYIMEARKGLKGPITVKQYHKCMPVALFELVKSYRIKRLGFDDRFITHQQFKNLKKYAPAKGRLITANNLVEDLRQIKESQEISCIRQALALHFKAYKHIEGALKVGVTERQIFEKLERFVKANRAGFSFPPIIAGGPNSSYPHAHITDRKFRNNEPILVDMGIDIKGYKSDLTRMYSLGRMSDHYKEVFECVRVAQQKAIENIKEGAKASEVDKAARSFLQQYRLAKYFGHSLGHGVGLEIHENPRLSQFSETILQENMVVTVEPAVYIPNKFGIRIEDMVLVTKEGCEVLSGNNNQ